MITIKEAKFPNPCRSGYGDIIKQYKERLQKQIASAQYHDGKWRDEEGVNPIVYIFAEMQAQIDKKDAAIEALTESRDYYRDRVNQIAQAVVRIVE